MISSFEFYFFFMQFAHLTMFTRIALDFIIRVHGTSVHLHDK